MSIHVAVGLVPVKRFNHEGLHQLQTDEDPHGRNLLLITDKRLATMADEVRMSRDQLLKLRM